VISIADGIDPLSGTGREDYGSHDVPAEGRMLPLTGEVLIARGLGDHPGHTGGPMKTRMSVDATKGHP
jgi:hypothetical protein